MLLCTYAFYCLTTQKIIGYLCLIIVIHHHDYSLLQINVVYNADMTNGHAQITIVYRLREFRSLVSISTFLDPKLRVYTNALHSLLTTDLSASPYYTQIHIYKVH